MKVDRYDFSLRQTKVGSVPAKCKFYRLLCIFSGQDSIRIDPENLSILLDYVRMYTLRSIESVAE